MSFIFGGDTGVTYEQLQQRRKMVDRLRNANTLTPKNTGEGLQAVARALVARGVDRQNAERATELKEQYSGLWNGLLGASGGIPSATGQTAGSFSAQPRQQTPEQRMGLDMGQTPESAAAGQNPTITAGGKEWDMGRDAVNPDMLAYRNAIASIESAGSGDYEAIGPTHPKLGRALGRYQIMEANIGPWSREVLGREVTPDEFMANPSLQDAIFDGKFGGYVEQFGPEGAAQAWFAGPGGVGKTGRKDVLGTSVGQYARKFNAALGNGSQGGSQGVQTTQAGGIDPTVIQLTQMLSAPDEFMPPGQKAVVQALLGQKLAQSQPMTPLQRQQFQMNQMEMEQMQQPSAPKIVEVNGVAATWDAAQGQYVPIEGFDNTQGGQIDVQSSQILDDGTVVLVARNGETKVRKPNGEIAEGEEAAAMIKAARDFTTQNQREIYGARVIGANEAEIATGGKAAAAKAIGGKQGDFVARAFSGADAVAGSIGNINTAISALDAGAKAGALERYIPNITEASATLQNSMDRMGLDVIGSVTFGALSEAELRLAMETAVPRNLNEADLRAWLVKKRDSQQKVRVALIEQARFLSDPQNTLQDWAEQVEEDVEKSGDPDGVPAAFIEQYKDKAEAEGITVDELWDAWPVKETYQ